MAGAEIYGFNPSLEILDRARTSSGRITPPCFNPSLEILLNIYLFFIGRGLISFNPSLEILSTRVSNELLEHIGFNPSLEIPRASA